MALSPLSRLVFRIRLFAWENSMADFSREIHRENREIHNKVN